MYQQNKSSESKVKFRQTSNCCKRVFEAAKLVYGNKSEELICSQKLNSDISLPVFSFRTNLKLHYISLTCQVVKAVITNPDLSKASGPDFVQMTTVVLKNCEPELSYILAELLTMCLKESFFPDCWMVPVFKNVGGKVYNCCLVSLFSVFNKSLKNL